MSFDDVDIANALITERRNGHDVFNIPLINERMAASNAGNSSAGSYSNLNPSREQLYNNQFRTVDQVKAELKFNAGEIKVNNIPVLTPDEIATQYSTILDNSLSLFDDQPTPSDIETKYSRTRSKYLHHHQQLYEVVGFDLKQWLHSAPVTHPRSQRNFLMDYSHLKDPMRRYLLSHSVNNMNRSIVDFAQRGGYSCFQRCKAGDDNKRGVGTPMSEEEKRCVHFCGETLAQCRKILATDWLNLSENLDHLQVPTLPAGHEMGDKETGTFNSSNRYSQWNQYAREDTTDVQWINSD